MPGLLPLLLTSSHLMLVADRVPEFNISPSCQAASATSTGVKRDQGACKKDEDLARAKLDREWAQYSPSQKMHCIQLSTLGGPASYVELTTCLEMSKAASALPPDLENRGPGASR